VSEPHAFFNLHLTFFPRKNKKANFSQKTQKKPPKSKSLKNAPKKSTGRLYGEKTQKMPPKPKSLKNAPKI
jgi:hypothetical protein